MSESGEFLDGLRELTTKVLNKRNKTNYFPFSPEDVEARRKVKFTFLYLWETAKEISTVDVDRKDMGIYKYRDGGLYRLTFIFKHKQSLVIDFDSSLYFKIQTNFPIVNIIYLLHLLLTEDLVDVDVPAVMLKQ